MRTTELIRAIQYEHQDREGVHVSIDMEGELIYLMRLDRIEAAERASIANARDHRNMIRLGCE